MTTLATILRDRIAENGPMSIADYMDLCLMHPTLGYYTTRPVFGAQGDFITAPEISQMFGEVIGLCLAQTWMDQGRPSTFTLAELGPGRGTLMHDVMRATAKVDGFHAAAQLCLYDASPALRQEQAKQLSDYSPQWIDHIDALPDQPLLLIANEFFDALPIRQFIRNGAGWQERSVGLQNDKFTFTASEVKIEPAFLAHRLDDTQDGDIVEICPQVDHYIGQIGTHINAHGGAALIIDYGDWRSLGDTFQAMKDHAYVDPLLTPGAADLTAHVDFEAIARAAPCSFSRVTPQGIVLERLGITARAEALAAQVSGQALDTLIAAHRRLTHPHEMGNLFKAIALFPNTAKPPAGFET